MSERLLPEVLDFFEHVHRDRVKECRFRFLMLSALGAIDILVVCSTLDMQDFLSIFGMGFIVGAWFWLLIDYLSARYMLAAYLRYEYEMKVLANIPEEKE